MKVKSENEVAQSCPILSDPTDCSLPGSSVHGIFQARVLEQGAIAFSGDNFIQEPKGSAQTFLGLLMPTTISVLPSCVKVLYKS